LPKHPNEKQQISHHFAAQHLHRWETISVLMVFANELAFPVQSYGLAFDPQRSETIQLQLATPIKAQTKEQNSGLLNTIFDGRRPR
jgi:hypothetical protein